MQAMIASRNVALALAVLATTSAGAAAAAPAAQGAVSAAEAEVRPLTVRPEVEPKGVVVSSTEAAPITSPGFTAKDAQPPPLAMSLGGNAALGRQKPEITAPAGLLKTNPDLPGGYRTVDVGVTAVF